MIHTKVQPETAKIANEYKQYVNNVAIHSFDVVPVELMFMRAAAYSP